MNKVYRSNYKNKLDYVYHILGLFIIYGTLGFLAESVFRNIIKGRVGKAGFLTFSPILPIYGFMGFFTYICAGQLEKLIDKKKGNRNEVLIAILIYLPFFAVSSALLEISGGFILEYIYGAREWNYSRHFLNFMGYISLKFTLMFSVVGTMHMFVLFYPLDKILVKSSDNLAVRIILSVISVAYFFDFIYTTIISIL